MIGKSYLLAQFKDGHCELIGVSLGSSRLYITDESKEVLALHVPSNDRQMLSRRLYAPPCMLILRKNSSWVTANEEHVRDIRVTVILQIEMPHGFAKRRVMPPGYEAPVDALPPPKRVRTKPAVKPPKQEVAEVQRLPQPTTPGARVVCLLDREPKKALEALS